MDGEVGRLGFSTPVFEWTATSDKKIIVHSGGTSSGKTYSILEYLIGVAITVPKRIITVVGQDKPNLRVGAYRDAVNIVYNSREAEYYQSVLVQRNKSDMSFTFTSGSVIEFKSYEDSQDAKSGKRHILFVNEANGVPYEIFDELQLRTDKLTIIDFNPTAEFWAHQKLKKRDDVDWFDSTFRDNPFLKDGIAEKIKRYEPTEENIKRGTADKYRWDVYGLGKIGRLEGLVFTNWEEGKFPDDYKWRIYGLDWGFTNDPTCLVEIRYIHGELYVNELIYRTNMTNVDISNEMDRLGVSRNELVIADSAEPKSIEELNRMGWSVKPATKGRDSIMSGIDFMKRYKIIIQGRNLAKEFNSYIYAKDKNNVLLNKPVDTMNHGIDAIRYGVTNKYKRLSNHFNEPYSVLI